MLDGFILTLRELAEMILIVGALCVYLREAGRSRLLAAVGWGVGIGVAPAAAAAAFLLDATLDGRVEALLQMAMALGVIVMATGMVASAVHIRGHVQRLADAWLDRAAAPLVIMGFVGLTVFRESMEIVVFLQAMAGKAEPEEIFWGFVCGAMVAAVLASSWRLIRWRTGLLTAFRASALLLTLLSIQMFLSGFSEWLRLQAAATEGQGHAWLAAAEPFLEGGHLHFWLSAGLMLMAVIHAFRTWWAGARPTA